MITASWQAEFHSFCHFLQPVLIYRKCYHQYAKLQCKRNCCLWPCTIDPILHVWRLKMKPLEKLMSSITSGFWKLCITTRLWTPEEKSSSLGLIFPFGISKNNVHFWRLCSSPLSLWLKPLVSTGLSLRILQQTAFGEKELKEIASAFSIDLWWGTDMLPFPLVISSSYQWAQKWPVPPPLLQTVWEPGPRPWCGLSSPTGKFLFLFSVWSIF